LLCFSRTPRCMEQTYEFVVCGTDPSGRVHTLVFRTRIPAFRPPRWLRVSSVCMRSPTTRCGRRGDPAASTSPGRPCCG